MLFVTFSLPLPKEIKKDRQNKLIKKKKECKQAFVNKLIGKTCDFLFEEQKDGYFEGYSENYVRLYLKEFLCTHDIVKVEIIAPFKDGALAKIKG